MTRTVTVTVPTTALAGTGHAFTIPAGTYQLVPIDGAEEGMAYIQGPDGLCAVSRSDGNIRFDTGEETK